MQQPTKRTNDDVASEPAAIEMLAGQRRIALQWGLLICVAFLIIAAVVAPNFALLVFVLLVGLGLAGGLTAWFLRLFNKWMAER